MLWRLLFSLFFGRTQFNGWQACVFLVLFRTFCTGFYGISTRNLSFLVIPAEDLALALSHRLREDILGRAGCSH